MTSAAPLQEPVGEDGQRYDVFISYSRKDVDFVARLERALEAYKAPAALLAGRRRMDVFRDAQDLTGPDYSRSIRSFLRRSAKVLVVCSPNARQSAFVDQEIEWFLETHDSADVIALLLDGSPNNEVGADDPRRAFPAQLCRAHAIPLAADYRGFDTKRNKVAKAPFEGPWYTLLANIYSIDRSTLEQRERLRQRRERRIVAGIACSVMLGLATAAVFSWVQMRRAEEQRNVAVKGFARYLAMHSEQAGPSSPDTGLLLAVEAARTTHDLDKTVTAEAESALRNALSRSGGMRLDIGTRGLSFSPDGRWLAQMQNEGAVTVWELSDGGLRAPVVTQLQTELMSLQAGPGNHLAVVTRNPTRIALLDLANLKQPPRWIEGRIGPIMSLQFSADGNTLLIVDQTADLVTVDLKDPAAAPQLLSGHTLRRQNDRDALGIRGAALSSTGRWIASAGWDNKLLLWDRTTPGAEPLQLLTGVNVDNPRFSADDRWLRVSSKATDASASAPPSLWYLGGSIPEPVTVELETTAPEPSTAQLTSTLTERFLTDDRLIENVGGRTLVWKLDPSMARIERRIPGTLTAIDGSHFVTVTQSSGGSSPEVEISVWDVSSTEAVADVRVPASVHAVGYSARGRVLVALTTEKELWSWHLDEDDFDDKPRRYANVVGNQLELAPSGREVIVGNWYDVARLWNVANPSIDPVRLSNVEDDAELRQQVITASSSGGSGGMPYGGLQQMLAFDNLSQRMAIPFDGGTFGIVNLEQPNRAPAAITMHEDSAVSAIAFSADGKLVAAGDRELNIRVWHTNDVAKPFAVLRVPEREGHTSSLSALVFSHSGTLLAASNAFGTVAVWDLSKPGADPVTLTNHEGWITTVAFSADDRNLLVAADDGKASLVPLSDPKAVRMLEGHTGVIRGFFSADNQFIVTAGKDANVLVWPMHDANAKPRILRGHNSPIITAAPVPQQQRLVTASAESLRVWDLADTNRAPQVVLLSEPLGIVTLSHDGHWLAAADMRDGIQLRRMDALDQPPLRMPAPLAQQAWALQFSPDDRWLAALTPGQGWLWRMRVDELMQVACESSGRNFEAPEWEQYLDDVPYRFTCSQWGLGPNYLRYATQEAERTAVDHATKLFTRAKELVPSLPFEPAAEARRLGVASVLKHGRDMARDGDTEDALIQLGRVREIDPESNFDPQQELERLRQASELEVKAIELAQAGKIDAAVATFRQVLKLDPGRGDPDEHDPRLGLDPVKRANEIYTGTK